MFASFSINKLLCTQNELSQLQRGYKALVSQMNAIFWQKLWYVQLEQFLMKYMWSASGLVMVGIPVMYTANARREDGELLMDSNHDLNLKVAYVYIKYFYLNYAQSHTLAHSEYES